MLGESRSIFLHFPFTPSSPPHERAHDHVREIEIDSEKESEWALGMEIRRLESFDMNFLSRVEQADFSNYAEELREKWFSLYFFFLWSLAFANNPCFLNPIQKEIKFTTMKATVLIVCLPRFPF